MGFGASPFGFGRLSMDPRDLARLFQGAPLGAPQGFTGSAGVTLPGQPEPQPRPFGFGAVPLPPQRPADLDTFGTGSVDVSGLAGAPGAPASARPLAPDTQPASPLPRFGDLPQQAEPPATGSVPIAGAAQEEPSMLDRAMAGIRSTDGLLTSLGIGLMSTPGFGQGVAAGLANHQQGEGRRAASRLAQAEHALKLQKLQREAGGVAQTVELLASRGYPRADAERMALAAEAGNRVPLDNVLGNAFPRNPDAPSGYTIDRATGRASYIPGGPQDPAMREAEAAATARGAASVKEPEPFTLGSNQTRFDGAGRPVASTGASRPDGFDVEGKLRGEFAKGLGTFQDVHDGYGRVIAATEQRAANPSGVSPASDIGLIFGYMKMLDPGSVVREGEYATAKNAAGIPDQVRNAYNKAVNGEFLTAEQRQDFLDTAGRLYGSARQSAEGVQNRYRGLASQYGADPDRTTFLPPALVAPDVGPSRQRGTSAAKPRDANARFQELLRSGMPKGRAYQKMLDEGF